MLDYTNLFSPNEYEKSDKIILVYFQKLKNYFWEKIFKSLRWEKCMCKILNIKSIENLKSLKHLTFVIKYCFFLVFVTNMEVKIKKFLKKKIQLRYLKLLF